jgi:hypothetical protein
VNNAGIGAVEFVDEAVARATFETKSMRPSASSTPLHRRLHRRVIGDVGRHRLDVRVGVAGLDQACEASGFLAVA